MRVTLWGDPTFARHDHHRIARVEKPLPNELIYYLVTYLKEQENAAVLAK